MIARFLAWLSSQIVSPTHNHEEGDWRLDCAGCDLHVRLHTHDGVDIIEVVNSRGVILGHELAENVARR